MDGISYIADEAGTRKAVVIDLRRHGHVWDRIRVGLDLEDEGESFDPPDPELQVLAEAGAKIAARAWEPEDFSHWPGYHDATPREAEGVDDGEAAAG